MSCCLPPPLPPCSCFNADGLADLEGSVSLWHPLQPSRVQDGTREPARHEAVGTQSYAGWLRNLTCHDAVGTQSCAGWLRSSAGDDVVDTQSYTLYSLA